MPHSAETKKAWLVSLVTEGDDCSRCAESSRSSNSTALTPPRAVQARQHALRLAYRVVRLSAIRRWRDVALQTGGGWRREGSGLHCFVRSRDEICRRPRFCIIASSLGCSAAAAGPSESASDTTPPTTLLPAYHDNHTHQHHFRPPLISYAASSAVRAQQAQTQSWPQEPRHRRSSTATRLVSGYHPCSAFSTTHH